jgi:UDP-GlcNAc:undecaprenyl-phosphate GlcNAc-1-phosphate transferase
MRSYIGLFLLAALFGLLVTPAVRRLGRRVRAYGEVREGQEQRHIPRLGGLAVFLATLAAWGVLLLVPNEVRARFLSEWRTLATLLVPGTLVLLVGVYDDLAGAAPWQKLIAETLAAGMVWWAGFRIVQLPIFGSGIHSPLLSLVLTVLWIVAVTNSLNLIDGLDGLAAGIAFFVTVCVFVISLIQGNHFVCILAITLAGALVGFLRFNFAPATIFLGDTGSLFLGFFLATFVCWRPGSHPPPAAPKQAHATRGSPGALRAGNAVFARVAPYRSVHRKPDCAGGGIGRRLRLVSDQPASLRGIVGIERIRVPSHAIAAAGAG